MKCLEMHSMCTDVPCFGPFATTQHTHIRKPCGPTSSTFLCVALPTPIALPPLSPSAAQRSLTCRAHATHESERVKGIAPQQLLKPLLLRQEGHAQRVERHSTHQAQGAGYNLLHVRRGLQEKRTESKAMSKQEGGLGWG